jgi:uncharacterized protein YcfJ
MKTAISLCLALLALSSAHAQIFRPEAVNGALLGGVAGAVIGNNSGDLRHNAWKGAAIGAGAGLILGEAVGNARDTNRNYRGRAGGEYVYRDSPRVSVGVGYSRGHYGYGYGHSSYHGRRGWDRSYGYYSYGWPGHRYSYAPVYSYYPGYGDAYPYYDTGYYRPASGASTGLLLGALAGGIIGHNSGDFRHNGWRGAAWGAGAGWLLGTIADANRRAVYEQAPVVVQPAPAVQAPAQPAPQQPVTIINNYYNTPSPMSSANGLFGR